MDKIFNSRFMQGLQKWGQDLGKNKFISSLQSAMMSLVSALLVGAIFQIIRNVLGPTMLKIITINNPWNNWLNIPFQFTMNFIALWVTLFLAYQYSEKLNLKSPLITTLDTLITFLIVSAPIQTTKNGIISIITTYLSAQGMFIGFLVAFGVVQIERFCYEKHIQIKMSDVVPPSLQKSFAAIIPLLFDVTIFLGIHIIVSVCTGGKYTLASGFMALISIPLKALTSTLGIFIIVFIALVLWTFGIHGSMIIGSICMPLMFSAISTNAALHAAGKAVVFQPVFLLNMMSALGGTGNTFPLVIMGIKAKSKQIKQVSRISLIPGWFKINEPVTFGMPIMYNPILAIPYILNTLVIMLITLIGYKIGFLTPSWIPIMSTLPIGFQSLLQTLSWKNMLWDYLMLIPSALVWYPFYKVYDRQLFKKEQLKENN